MNERPLCHFDDIAEPGARGFPHIGTPLDFMPDQFLTRDRRHLLCSTHGALFEIATGLCIYGPCKGRSLRAVSVALRDGVVVVSA